MCLRTCVILVALWPLCAPAAEPLSYDQIDEAARTLTEAQWDEHARRLVGRTVTWSGEVTEVSKNWLDDLYEVKIDMDRTGISDVSFDVPRGVAIGLQKDGRYRFRGTIRDAYQIFGGATINLDAVTFIQE